MQCQECDKTATFHITELAGGKPQEVHLCEDHAREYLSHGQEEQPAAPTLAGVLAHQLAIGQTAEDLARLDKRTCPMCGISFYEFRDKGRFGCPHDYVCFADELEALLANIHGETKHVGKCPQHSATDSAKQTELIRLRREMKNAISAENYERASTLRDEIRQIEAEVGEKQKTDRAGEEGGE
ncbi:MAG: DNA helicase UvrBC [Planctomycetales bacterium]|nr:DNA helicase UvrBC [Planctomycetales bacterium]NIM09431.1 DNA helicase UvrBC [Planctomycetales bacterium]NIN08909.1 DNA helicase UvrBC [Planctomycetales bacterium]NIN78024.1 DNA helicase UvrBC [Planctomycetales bacterium]NIO35212.1 DNA helicase UvrBC [Planctomycetales bacterium]